VDYIQQLIERYPLLESVKSDISASFDIIANSYANGGKLLIAGNGGSSSDAEHIAGELMKNFVKKRKLPEAFQKKIESFDPDISAYLLPRLQPGLPAISLSGHSSLNTACINDIDGNITFSAQVYGYGKPGDVFLGISTTGNSKNIVYAAVTAKARELKTIALTGSGGGRLKTIADISIIVPEKETYKIQELHLPVYHCLCLMIEEYFFQ
jgi:D-sedoheptulose 7-phosphate isomerase